MKNLVFKSLLGKSLKELIKKRREAQKALYDLVLKHSLRALKQVHHIKIARKNVARINTAIAFLQKKGEK